MHNLSNKNKKNKSIVTTAKVLSLAAILIVAIGVGAAATVIIGINQSAEASSIIDIMGGRTMKMRAQAPTVVTGDNIYIAWWTNNTENGNEEVMFRASTDGGATFGDKINLSNSPDTESQTAEILAAGNNRVFVTWWELNENVHPHTSESVMRVSTDAGQTFGPVMNLGTNGTITTTTTSGNTTTTTSAAG